MEADAIIRERTNGKKSLDDFCRKFLGGGPTTAKVVPYELAEIVKDLQELADFDWESFLLKRVAQPLDELPLEVVSRCGYKVQYSTRDAWRADEPPEPRRQEEFLLWIRSACRSAQTEPSPRSSAGGLGDRAGIRPGNEDHRRQQQDVQPAATARRA